MGVMVHRHGIVDNRLVPVIEPAYLKYIPSASSCWTDTVGGTQAGIGDNVAYIQDDSGNGRHLYFSAPGVRPTLQREATGEYYLNFDGGDVGSVSANLSAFQEVTIVSAWSRTSTASDQISYEFSANYNATAGTFVMVLPNGGNVLLNAHNSTSGAGGYSGYSTSRDGLTPAIYSHMIDFSGNTRDNESVAIRTNGVSDKVAPVGPYSNANPYFANTDLFIGGRSGLALPITGKMFFFGIYTTPLNYTVTENVEKEASTNVPGLNFV